jgi:chaperonin GroES
MNQYLHSDIIPLGDRVAIKPLQQENKTSGGIIIPDTAKEKPMKGEVIAVGKGIKNDSGQIVSPEVQIGDIVLYGKWGGTEIKMHDQEMMIMKESDILAILK